jgi:hypothetical protein
MKFVKNKCDNILNLRKWKDYEHDYSDDMIKRNMLKCVTFYLSHGVESRRINLVEYEVPIREFINRFQNSRIYQYVQHIHATICQDLQFQTSPGTF